MSATVAWLLRAGLNWPISVLVVSALLLFSAAWGMTRLYVDTRAEAFIAADHPVVVYRNKTTEIFGLKDPMIVAVTRDEPGGIYTPDVLRLAHDLTARLAEVPGIDPDRITSLATENNIVGDDDGMQVEPFLEDPPYTPEQADRLARMIADFPLYHGSLVGRDGKATVIVAELLDADRSEVVYHNLLDMVGQIEWPPDVEIHVAGEGAVVGYMGAYIESDARRLNPFAMLVIAGILGLAYRTVRGVVIPLVLVGGTVAATFGIMAWAGIPVYIITNALPVILIGIAVADSIHILGQYYEEAAARPGASARDIVQRTMAAMWRPVTVTSVTTVAGFLGIAVTTDMPPMQAFGWFAALGVVAAWVLSLLALPAALVLFKPRMGPAYRKLMSDRDAGGAKPDWFGRIMVGVGMAIAGKPKSVLGVALATALAGAASTSFLVVDDARIEAFQPDEPIARADRAINRHMDGTNFLDIVIETGAPEGLFEPAVLRRIEDLQAYIATLLHVGGSTSIVDYLKQMNRVLRDGRADAYVLPDQSDLIAQYFLLYSISGDPDDMKEEVDHEYRRANVRVSLKSGFYSDEAAVVEPISRYLAEHFSDGSVQATITGRVAIDYYWLRDLLATHFASVAMALVTIWAVAAMSFRSLMGGVLALLPVAVSVLLTYAAMALSGIRLSVATAMIAAIAIGIGVDFAIHTIERFREFIHARQGNSERALRDMYATTGRALMFNFLAVSAGFSVLMISHVPSLIQFGMLVGVAVAASFVSSLTVLPALLKLIRPRFVYGVYRDGPEVVVEE